MSCRLPSSYERGDGGELMWQDLVLRDLYNYILDAVSLIDAALAV